MGSIKECEKAGIPKGLLISVSPPNGDLPVSKGGKNPNGKAPAIYVPEDPAQKWHGAGGWQHGMDERLLDIADAQGANAGILCGVPIGTQQYVMIDIDMIDHKVARNFRDAFLADAVERWDDDLVIRNTVPYRAMIIISLPVGAPVSSKVIIPLFLQQPGTGELIDIGKIELLGRGSQAVIAGIHTSGNKITWCTVENPTEIFFAPPISLGIKEFYSFDEIAEEVIKIVESFAPMGITIGNVTGLHSYRTAPVEDLESLAAPNAQAIIDLLNRMPNPEWLNRDRYVTVMMAASGARMGLLTQGKLTPEEDEAIAQAAASWAARWEGQNPSSYEAELHQWKHNFTVKQHYYVGWERLCMMGKANGVEEIAVEQAQEQFKTDLMPLPSLAPLPEETPLPVVSEAKKLLAQVRSGETKLTEEVDIKQAEVQIATAMQFYFQDNFYYLSDEKRWIFYEEGIGWKADSTAHAHMAAKLQTFMLDYVKRHGSGDSDGAEGWPTTIKIKMLSQKTVEHVENLLKDRLALERKNIDKGVFILQTPAGAYDLRTGLRIAPNDQKKLLDTRLTTVTPRPGTTPRFDNLIYNLSDGNPAISNYILNYLGYALLGSPRERIFLFVWGTGANGKSTLLRLMKNLFGNYAVDLNNKVFLNAGNNLHPTSLNRIRGARIIMASEFPKKEKWNESLIKQITGQDEIFARGMYKDEQAVISEGALIFVGQHIPQFEQVDKAIVDRARITGSTFEAPKGDRHWEEKMVAEEGPAIMNKLMRYAKAVYERGLLMPDVPPLMLAQAREYIMDSDSFFSWITDECVTGARANGNSEELSVLRSRYVAYMRRRAEDGDIIGDAPLGPKEFLHRLRLHGVKTEDDQGQKLTAKGKNTVYVAQGIRLKVKAVA